MNDDSVLRKIARESIAKGLLPNYSPQQTWGGPGTGVRCALCEASINKDELEFEVEFGRERHHLHLACFSAWDAERKALGALAVSGPSPAEAAKSSVERPTSSSRDRDRVLPDRKSDGKIIANGGERSYKPGAV